MKTINYLIYALAIALAIGFNSCKNDEDTEFKFLEHNNPNHGSVQTRKSYGLVGNVKSASTINYDSRWDGTTQTVVKDSTIISKEILYFDRNGVRTVFERYEPIDELATAIEYRLARKFSFEYDSKYRETLFSNEFNHRINNGYTIKTVTVYDDVAKTATETEYGYYNDEGVLTEEIRHIYRYQLNNNGFIDRETREIIRPISSTASALDDDLRNTDYESKIVVRKKENILEKDGKGNWTIATWVEESSNSAFNYTKYSTRTIEYY